MRVLIDTIRISGLRGIKNLEVSLPRIAVLIGPNNSGKTSLIKAMRLSLGDYSRLLSEEDFHIDQAEQRVSEILVDLRIIPVDVEWKQIPAFDQDWTIALGEKIKAEANGNQFVALRTRAKPNLTKGSYETLRYHLDRWPLFHNWSTDQLKESVITRRLDNILFNDVDAQRDIHSELRQKASFVGRVLSAVEYQDSDIKAIEALVETVNKEAIEKSQELKDLKAHLDQLNQSFENLGKTEITPFPKKLRDLSKNFSVHFGDDSKNSFSMEYHGMGTRSWASLLTTKAFIELASKRYEKDARAFSPIFAAEEPEAHLHPNAQRTLYQQLSETSGQVIVSTHSPYLAAIANLNELRFLRRDHDNIFGFSISTITDSEEERRLRREVIQSRGEILFSKALILCEGETEEQALPTLLEKYFGRSAFRLGVNIVGVGGSGKKYLPFFRLAKNVDMPVFVFSDGETKIVKELSKHYQAVFGQTDISKCPNITILTNTDFEGYLINNGFQSIVEAAVKQVDGATYIEDWINKRHGTCAGREKTANPPCPSCKQPIYADVVRDYQSTGGRERALEDILSDSKPKYAPVIADLLSALDPSKYPTKVIELFENIKKVVKL